MYACPLYGVHFTLPLWTFAHSCVALTSNSPRFLAPFGLLPCLPQLQRPIHHGFLLLLDFCLLPRSFNVQSTTVSCSFWTSTMPPAALTSNSPRFLAHFGLLPASPQLWRPIRHVFLLLLDFCHASRSFNVQSTTHPIHHASKPRLPSHKLPTTQKSNTSTSVPALLYIF